MYEELQLLRALRPCNGGSAYDESVLSQLRALNFDVPASNASEQLPTRSKL